MIRVSHRRSRAAQLPLARQVTLERTDRRQTTAADFNVSSSVLPAWALGHPVSIPRTERWEMQPQPTGSDIKNPSFPLSTCRLEKAYSFGGNFLAAGPELLEFLEIGGFSSCGHPCYS